MEAAAIKNWPNSLNHKVVSFTFVTETKTRQDMAAKSRENQVRQDKAREMKNYGLYMRTKDGRRSPIILLYASTAWDPCEGACPNM